MRRGLRADACAAYGSDTGTPRTGSWLPVPGGPGHGLDYRQTLTAWLPRTGWGRR